MPWEQQRRIAVNFSETPCLQDKVLSIGSNICDLIPPIIPSSTLQLTQLCSSHTVSNYLFLLVSTLVIYSVLYLEPISYLNFRYIHFLFSPSDNFLSTSILSRKCHLLSGWSSPTILSKFCSSFIWKCKVPRIVETRTTKFKD